MRRQPSTETQRLATLLELNQALSGTLNLKHSLHRALEILESRHGMFRSAVTLERADGGLHIEASNGISAEGQRAQYRLGEGITGRVVESGKPIIVPQVSKEPMLLNRAAQRKGLREELTYFCVPIMVGRKTVGALGVDMRFKKDRDYDRTVKFLRVIAGIIGQAVRVEGLVQAETRKLVAENTQLREELRERYDFSNMVGSSGSMRQVYEQIVQVAGTSTSVLIRGESGTGKELIAHAIHYNSPRAKKPFIKVSCAALPDTLIESELFGYEKGAFTGAHARKPGRLEMAEGGTLFLDEIGDLNPTTQVKLLRVIQEREFERLGGTETIKIKARLITATNKDLEKAISEGTFREDLYYRLNVARFVLPPLRDRREDIPLLVQHFLEKYGARMGRKVRLGEGVMDFLQRYEYPGNIRELENLVEQGVALAMDGVIRIEDIMPHELKTPSERPGASRSLQAAVDRAERAAIEETLSQCDGNKEKAADILGLSSTTLWRKMKRLGIVWP